MPKLAEVDPAAALSPIPMPQVGNNKAPGLRGPHGLAPRTNYTRVNTGMPPEPQVGNSISDTSPQTGAPMGKTSEVSAAARPFGIQDMVKEAMASALNKVRVSSEATQELKAQEKVASVEAKGAISTSYCTKLANALSFMSTELEKDAAHMGGPYTLTEHKQEPGTGPGALHVMEAIGGPPISHASGVSTQPVPKHPGQEKHLPGEHGANMMETNLHHAPGGGEHQKTSSAPVALIKKLASKEKVAEDAINPAQISAGPAAPNSGKAALESAGSAPGAERFVGSNEAAINYKKNQAKATPKAELKAVLDEPALSGEHDKVLQNAFAHTGQAGTKFASLSKVAQVEAARAVLSKLAQKAG